MLRDSMEGLILSSLTSRKTLRVTAIFFLNAFYQLSQISPGSQEDRILHRILSRFSLCVRKPLLRFHIKSNALAVMHIGICRLFLTFSNKIVIICYIQARGMTRGLLSFYLSSTADLPYYKIRHYTVSLP